MAIAFSAAHPGFLPRFIAWVVLFALAFWPTFLWMAERFDAYDSFYSHGWLIPAASAWLIWQRRSRLKALVPNPSYGGLLLLLPGLLLHGVAVWLRIYVVSGFAMLMVLAGLIWTAQGRAALSVLRFPLAFLVFMVPLPGILLIAVSFKMKLMAATLATHVLGWMGVAAARFGSTIQLPGVSVIVDDTCSGLRSLISLLALSIFWTSLLAPGTASWKKYVLIAASVPIALVANMVRIVLLALVALIYGAAAAEGFLHYGSGFVLFIVAIMILGWLSSLLGRSQKLSKESA